MNARSIRGLSRSSTLLRLLSSGWSGDGILIDWRLCSSLLPCRPKSDTFRACGLASSLQPDRSGIGRLDRGLLRLMSSRLLGCDTPDGLRRIPGIGVCLFVCCVEGKEGGDLQDQQPVRVHRRSERSPLTRWLAHLTPAHSSSPLAG